jgi:hypothetical protein
MSQNTIEFIAGLIDRCRDLTLQTAGKVPDTHRFRQLQEGKAHPLWLVGHLAGATNAVALHWVLGAPSVLDKSFGKMFAPDFMQGDPITTNPANYLAWDEVVATYERVMRHYTETLRTFNDEDLAGPPKGQLPDPLKAYFPTLGMGVGMMVGHDSHHRGQIAMIANLK